MKTVHKKRITAWVDALESGLYKQTRGALKGKKGYCCLGVACDVFEKVTRKKVNYNDNSTLPKDVAKWYGLRSTDPGLILETGRKSGRASSLNDSGHSNFYRIANAVRLTFLNG